MCHYTVLWSSGQGQHLDCCRHLARRWLPTWSLWAGNQNEPGGSSVEVRLGPRAMLTPQSPSVGLKAPACYSLLSLGLALTSTSPALRPHLSAFPWHTLPTLWSEPAEEAGLCLLDCTPACGCC